MASMMLAETSFITIPKKSVDKITLLKNEAIDRLDPVVCDLPKYKKKLEELIVNFTVDDMLRLMNIIDRDNEFKCSRYYKLYNSYFDEIEDLIHKHVY